MENIKMSSTEKKYTQSLNDKEKKALSIAANQLGSSFSMEKSIGYLKWERSISGTK